MTLGLFDVAFVGALPRYDADAQDYINRVIAADVAAGNNSGLESGVQDAINAFVVGSKANGIWNAIKASCILAGARTLQGCLVPLVGAAPTRFGAAGGWNYNRKTGLQGNGTDNYLNSNYALLAALQNNRHASAWASAVHSSGSRAYFGSSSSVAENAARTQLLVAAGAEDKLATRVADETTTPSATSNNVAGFQGVSRSASASYTRRAASANQTVTTSSLAGNDNNMFIFARNNTASVLHSNARLSFYSIGESLDLALLDARVTALMNALAAAIP